MFHKNGLFHTGIGFDMRIPDFGAPPREVYATALEMIDYADRNGVQTLNLQEHHGSEDGYLPTPFLMGTAAAARTKNIAILLSAVILPFHDPVKVAEQIAVSDLISNGRIYTILAAGYSATEFAAFRVTLKDRARLMDEGLDIILRALSGERFVHKDREVFVRPLPQRPPREIIYGGAGAPAAARRAARFGLPFAPMNDAIVADYDAECGRLGRAPGNIIPGTMRSVYVTDDPERGWREVGPHILHYMRSYAVWSGSAESSASPYHGIDTPEKIRALGRFKVVTPDEAVELGLTQPIGVRPMIGGLSPALSWKSLELFVEKVIPRLKDAPRNWRAAQELTAPA